MASTKHIFVVGCPRSGTTEFAYLISLHPDIFVGSERYLYRFTRNEDWTVSFGDALHPDLFNAERYLHVQPGDTYFSSIEAMDGWDTLDAAHTPLREKPGRVKILGEKAPVGIFYIRELHCIFPQAEFIILLRDIVSVCRSWQQRAEDEADGLWQREDGFAAGVKFWLNAITETARLMREEVPIMTVFSPFLYRSNRSELGLVMERLHAGNNAHFDQMIALLTNDRNGKRNPQRPTEAEKQIIFDHFGELYNFLKLVRGMDLPYAIEELFWPSFQADYAAFEVFRSTG